MGAGAGIGDDGRSPSRRQMARQVESELMAT
jgi:hypothetical protein